jgi:2-polyprenyl-3-methyl-5-hydroxy-6-metoxy-1,4-benzoquinol methylase
MNKPALDYFNDRAKELAAQYNALDREKVHADLLSHLPESTALRVLDIGAGSGADAAMFAAKGYQVLAAEPADALRTEGQKTFQNKNIQWSAEALPEFGAEVAAEKPFDVVTSVGVLQYLDQNDRLKSLKEMFSLVSKGGFLEIQYPTPASREHQFTIEHNEIENARQAFNQEAGVNARFEWIMDKSVPDFTGRKALNGQELHFRTAILQRVK